MPASVGREEQAVKVFLSYRRTDVGGYAGRLGDDLVGLLGAKSVFQDVTAIRPGQDFVRTIDRALVDCDVVLAVIGPGWLTATTPEGASRLLDPEDFVRVELSRALDREVPVIPVLVGNADLPKAADLPHSWPNCPSAKRWCCTTPLGARMSRAWCGPCAASHRCRPATGAAGSLV